MNQKEMLGEDRLTADLTSEVEHLISVRKWIHDNTGMHYPDRKASLLYQRLVRLCRRLGIASLADLQRNLENGDIPELYQEMACAVSTNHTYFFREPETMTFFQHLLWPELAEEPNVRIWSAAASSGEEAYSVALMLIDQLGSAEAVRKQVSILGTDIDYTAVAQAETAEYADRRMETVDPELRKQHFRATTPGMWQLKPAVKQLVIFRRLNLMSNPWPFEKPFHVIWLRNVLYYFDRNDQRALVERMYEATLPGGWLITSVTESLLDLRTDWRMVKSGVYRKL